MDTSSSTKGHASPVATRLGAAFGAGPGGRGAEAFLAKPRGGPPSAAGEAASTSCGRSEYFSQTFWYNAASMPLYFSNSDSTSPSLAGLCRW